VIDIKFNMTNEYCHEGCINLSRSELGAYRAQFGHWTFGKKAGTTTKFRIKMKKNYFDNGGKL